MEKIILGLISLCLILGLLYFLPYVAESYFLLYLNYFPLCGV